MGSYSRLLPRASRRAGLINDISMSLFGSRGKHALGRSVGRAVPHRSRTSAYGCAGRTASEAGQAQQAQRYRPGAEFGKFRMDELGRSREGNSAFSCKSVSPQVELVDAIRRMRRRSR
jgi:hypothetical protein